MRYARRTNAATVCAASATWKSANPVIVAATLPLLAWVALFHVADAAQTVAAFVLRAYRIATLPLLIYVVALWGVGLGGGYLAAFDPAGISPAWMHSARGFWSMSTLGLVVAALALCIHAGLMPAGSNAAR